MVYTHNFLEILLSKTSKKENKEDAKNQNFSEDKLGQKTTSWVTWAVFIFTIVIVLLSLVSVVFPALIASGNSTIKNLQDLGVVLFEVEPFQAGIWAGPLVVGNILVFIGLALYYKKRLPGNFKKLIDFVFNFEISKKISVIVIIVLLSIYVGFSFQELTTEEEWEDYHGVKQRLESWSPDQITSGFEPHIKYFMHWSSMILFGHYTVVPFLASISLLLLTYFFTSKISKKRFAGIVAFVILLQSNLFLTYDTTVSYTNFWILFYLLSLYLLYKVWPLSPILYLLSIFSKALTATFLPMSLFFIFRSKISTTTKIIVSASSTALILIGIIVATTGANVGGIAGEQEEFDWDEFALGFTSFSFQLRFDGLVLIFILPLIVGLFIASRNRIHHADSMMVFIGGILFITPLVTGFTELTNQPYRFVPLLVFFAIGVGVLLSKRQV